MKVGSRGEVTASHLTLPKACRPKLGSCILDTNMYIWQPELPRCQLELLQTMETEQDEQYLIDHHSKLIIKLLALVPTPPGCHNNRIFYTPYKDIFVSPHNSYSWPSYAESGIYLPAMIRAMSDYTMWQSEKAVRKML